MTDAPQYFRWDADKSVMIPYRKALADRTYVDGQEYRLGSIEERSDNSHKAFFAAVKSAWDNLPHAIAENYPTPDHLRKACLIETGFFDQQEYICTSKAEALRWATNIRGMDEYARVVVRGNIVVRRVAKSQSFRAMGKQDFQRSKEMVLDYLSALIGVKPEALQQNSGRAA